MTGSWLLVFRFAGKMLLHERGKTLGGACGVAFAVCLTLVQIGLYRGALRSMSIVIQHSTADVWVMPRGVQNFENPLPLVEHDAYRVRGVPGVARVEPLVVSGGQWRLPAGGTESVLVLGLQPGGELLRPWNLCAGDFAAIDCDRNVLIDAGDFKKLHCPGLGGQADLVLAPREAVQARVVGTTEKVRTFIATPVVMTGITNARAFARLDADVGHYLLVRVAPGNDPRQVARDIGREVPILEALSRADFAARTEQYWDTNTGVGLMLYSFAFMGVAIGVGTVSAIQYISAMHHLREYAILKALGAPNRRVVALVIAQSLLLGLPGFGLGGTLAAGVQRVLERQEFLLGMYVSLPLLAVLFVGTLALCAAAALVPALKIIYTDPELVFRG